MARRTVQDDRLGTWRIEASCADAGRGAHDAEDGARGRAGDGRLLANRGANRKGARFRFVRILKHSKAVWYALDARRLRRVRAGGEWPPDGDALCDHAHLERGVAEMSPTPGECVPDASGSSSALEWAVLVVAYFSYLLIY